ncbi:MAG: hypothetical protein OEX07_16150, partial [Gammaproteobacteria bacterium]|nr:hypothetical protein [Gammaproteobacteria bacterium]
LLFIVIVFAGLTGCPAKDWVKRDDAYLTVDQYKIMTEVISINDTLYRVKKGEEINQNKITQLFVNLQQYINTPKNRQGKVFKNLKKNYLSEKSTFNSLTYALVLLERKTDEDEVLKVLSGIGRNGITPDEKNLANLAHILHSVLSSGVELKKQYAQLTNEHDLIKEEVSYLNKQINALKSIEESIHAREVGVE